MKPEAGILIIDTDTTARRSLHCDLLNAGFAVADADNPEEAIALSRVMHFDLVLAVAGSRDRGVETCRSLCGEIPRAAILILSPNRDPDRTAELLDAGADQCLPRDLYVPELIARLRAALRRSQGASQRSADAITIGGIRLEPEQRAVYRDGVPVRLTPKEFALLHHLMTHAGLPMAHESLLKAVWGDDHVGRVEYLRIFMRQLRTKLNDDIDPRYLLTDSCIGYRFVEPGKAPGVEPRVHHAAAA